nr:MAG TPA: hypothetical protein [Caudoviricetes sp.]
MQSKACVPTWGDVGCTRRKQKNPCKPTKTEDR